MMSFDDDFGTRIFKIVKNDDEKLTEWHHLKESVDSGNDDGTHYLEIRASGGVVIGVAGHAQISGDRQEIINAVLDGDNALKTNASGTPNHRCPYCGKLGLSLGSIKTNSKGTPSKQHFACTRCGTRYKI
jgi:DNA-directed RNA polymerase subunit M/transcription elongation factor TFIIS